MGLSHGEEFAAFELEENLMSLNSSSRSKRVRVSNHFFNWILVYSI